MRRATVEFDLIPVMNGSVDAIGALLRLPDAEIRAKQAAIARHAHCMHYLLEDNAAAAGGGGGGGAQPPDAFDITMRGSWLLAQRPASCSASGGGRAGQVGPECSLSALFDALCTAVPLSNRSASDHRL